MNTELQKIALRHNALYLPSEESSVMSPSAAALVKSLADHGYTLSEDALHSVNAISDNDIRNIISAIEDIFGTRLNWASLIKNWLRPTGETWADHRLGYFINAFPKGFINGKELPCGHVIPPGLFDMSRYNGCPLCGTPFRYTPGANVGGSAPSTVLGRMTDKDMKHLMRGIIEAPVPPSATDAASLAVLADYYGIPAGIRFGNTETCIMLSGELFKKDKIQEALDLISDAPMLMRMLWYCNTGSVRIIKKFDNPAFHLHYNRPRCKAVAQWLDSIATESASVCEQMNPNREMWVRFIRALRLTEYARRLNLTYLQKLLDVFYRKAYSTWSGEIEAAETVGDFSRSLELLCERPGAFTRRLFSTMLTAGAEPVLTAFRTIEDKLPPRMMCTLAGAAPLWFAAYSPRSVSLADGRRVSIEANPKASTLSEQERQECIAAIKTMADNYFLTRYRAKGPLDETLFIDNELWNIPVPVGDRGISVSDNAIALQGQVFNVRGDNVRLFLQWGQGLPAQHLDMDLSAKILYDGSTEDCAYYNLYPEGATHSGDIQHIPDNIGTAEYIELDIPRLKASGAHYVVFACNAYSTDRLSPNLRVGWMDSESPMTVNDDTGVAYDPSAVQHIVHISANPSRGLVFGILDVDSRSITWLELPNSTQRMEQLDIAGVKALVDKLRSKVSIGELLEIYAKARGCRISSEKEDADRIFDIRWAADSAAVATLLL